jgi:hypothetical protein
LIGGKLRICFLDRSTKLETVNDLETKPRGGMVSSLFKVSDYLSEQGHEVWVISDIKEPGRTSHGVIWLNELFAQVPIAVGEPWYEFDFLICNRGIGGSDIKAKPTTCPMPAKYRNRRILKHFRQRCLCRSTRKESGGITTKT